MNGNDFLVDTNILIYFQNGFEGIDTILESKNMYISFISEMELLSYPNSTKQELLATRTLLEECFIIEMNQEIKNKAIEIRSTNNIKLPDAIVAATSLLYKLPLITADKGFSKVKELDVILVNV